MSASLITDVILALGIGAFVIAVLAIAMFARRERKPAPSTDAMLDDITRRMSTAEQQLKTMDHDLKNVRQVVGNLPTKESIHQIGVQVAESRGKIEGMQVTLHSQTRSLDRIEDFLMKTSAEAIVGRGGEKSNGDQR